MEIKQTVDLERVYQMFCEKASIESEDDVVIKNLKHRHEFVHIQITVKTNYGFKIYQGLYYCWNQELCDIAIVTLGKNDIAKLAELI